MQKSACLCIWSPKEWLSTSRYSTNAHLCTQHTKYKAHLNRAENHKHTNWPNHIHPHLKTWSSSQRFHVSPWLSQVQADLGGLTAQDSNMPHSLWMKSTLYNSDFQFKQKRSVNAHFWERKSIIKNHTWVRCACLTVPSTKGLQCKIRLGPVYAASVYAAFSGCCFIFTAVERTSRLAIKEIIWRKHSAIPKEKVKQTPLPPHQL